jgi:hypothetical protein
MRDLSRHDDEDRSDNCHAALGRKPVYKKVGFQQLPKLRPQDAGSGAKP